MTQNILLVEDDRNFGDVLKSYLEMHDYDVTLATDGEEGYDAFKAVIDSDHRGITADIG